MMNVKKNTLQIHTTRVSYLKDMIILSKIGSEKQFNENSTIFTHNSFKSRMDKNVLIALTWYFCMCCNPANGRVNVEECLAYKE